MTMTTPRKTMMRVEQRRLDFESFASGDEEEVFVVVVVAVRFGGSGTGAM